MTQTVTVWNQTKFNPDRHSQTRHGSTTLNSHYSKPHKPISMMEHPLESSATSTKMTNQQTSIRNANDS